MRWGSECPTNSETLILRTGNIHGKMRYYIKNLIFFIGNADKIFNSWSYWQYKYFNDITTAAQSPDAEGFWNTKGELQEKKVSALSRSYAYKICGEPVQMKWSRYWQTFNLKIKINRQKCKSDQHTEIYLSEYFFYQNGYTATFKNCQDCRLQAITETKGYYQILGDQDINSGTIYELKVTKK